MDALSQKLDLFGQLNFNDFNPLLVSCHITIVDQCELCSDFFTFQVPCILVFANKWFSHQISSFGPDEFLFLGIYGLLIPILSVLIAWLKNYSLAKRKNM